MSKNLDFCLLLDLYGGLISKKQYEAMDYYYNQDLSLSEIGELLQISRQAVRNNIKCGEENILEFENRLGLKKTAEKNEKKIREAALEIKRLNKAIKNEMLERCADELLGIELI